MCKLPTSRVKLVVRLPIMWVVPAEFYVWPAHPLFQPGVGHFQWVLLVSQCLFERLNQHLSLEDLLQSLGEQTKWIQKEMMKKMYCC